MSASGEGLATSRCPGCGVELPARDGPVHRYMTSSPACWDTFGRILAKEFGDPGYWPPHTLTVDTFAAQHPGEETDQARHSVAFHLVGLCLVVERGREPTESGWLRQRHPNRHKDYPWLPPPEALGAVTTADVVEADTPEEHDRMVRAWAASVWEAWGAHHDTVRAWTDRLETMDLRGSADAAGPGKGS